MILNTIVTETIDCFATELEKAASEDFNEALQSLLRRTIREHHNIIFNGDNYSAAWVEEAQKRGLPNTPGVIDALKVLKSEKTQQLFSKYGVLHASELVSRHDVFVEEYHRKIKIEGEVALEMVRSQIYPAVMEEFAKASRALESLRSNNVEHGVAAVADTVKKLGAALDELHNGCAELENALGNSYASISEAHHKLRQSVDSLELMVNDAAWPLPKYREMLFVY